MVDRAGAPRARFAGIDDDRSQAANRVATHLAAAGDEASGSLLGPYSLEPWGRGLQTATCSSHGGVAIPTCSCGVCFTATLDVTVLHLLPSDTEPYSRMLHCLPHDLMPSVAIGRIATVGPWMTDHSPGAYRATSGLLEELWISPGCLQSADALVSEYGVPVHQGAGTFTSWLLSLVPWGDAAAVATPELLQKPAAGDIAGVLVYGAAMEDRTRRLLERSKQLLSRTPTASE